MLYSSLLSLVMCPDALKAHYKGAEVDGTSTYSLQLYESRILFCFRHLRGCPRYLCTFVFVFSNGHKNSSLVLIMCLHLATGRKFCLEPLWCRVFTFVLIPGKGALPLLHISAKLCNLCTVLYTGYLWVELSELQCPHCSV